MYASHTADPQCVAGMTGVGCALGVSTAPTSAQMGAITVCPMDPSGFPAGPGYCSGTTFEVSFTVDTTKAEGTIEVQ